MLGGNENGGETDTGNGNEDIRGKKMAVKFKSIKTQTSMYTIILKCVSIPGSPETVLYLFDSVELNDG